ncbi:MAG TPA: histidine kinase [Steroidobacteraceae bacterium]|jgi:hypothetical protein|nr:histidine kinase [Steroidobacteraceae bacterium]
MYPLREPLPADVVAHAAGPFGGYRRYPVFSAPWLLGRCAIFMPITGALGLLQAGLIGVGLNDSKLGWQVAAYSVPIWLAFGTAGPVMATVARHRFRPAKVPVTLAIGLGLVVSFMGQHLAEIYTRAVVLPRYMALFPGFGVSNGAYSSGLLIWAIRGWQFGLFCFLGGGVALMAFFREQHWWQISRHAQQLALANREKEEADLRLMVLQAQVEPHFLFNTLASVHSLIRQDPARAEATLEALADHLRVTLPKLRTDVGNAYSTLAEQLEICRSYLTVMKVRMGPRFSFIINVDAALEQHPFPPLLLISLVENAIKHGIERSTGSGQIMVNAAVDSLTATRQLVVSVVDTGAGLRATAAVGMGLNNIRDQLIARFGPRGSLTLQDRTAGGVIATVRVPYEAAA